MPGNAHIMKAQVAAIKRVIQTLPPKVGKQIIVFSKQRFAEQNWIDTTTQPWKHRTIGGRKNAGRAILVKSGRLRRSPRIIRTTTNSVTVGSDVPYAAIHNNGFKGLVNVEEHTRNVYGKQKKSTGVFSVKTKKEKMRTIKAITGSVTVQAHTRRVNMPRRRFLGNSAYLNKQITRLIGAELMRAKKSR